MRRDGRQSLPGASFPGSAWERTAGEALPRVSCRSAGRACRAARSQAEPGNEDSAWRGVPGGGELGT